MKIHLFKIECLTDLHVGNGEANYSIIDNEVQKDTVLSDVPVIHASSLKGALRDHFQHLWGEGKKDLINEIFGDKDNAGSYKFFGALCIARPLRVSSGRRPYMLCAGADALESFSHLLKGLGVSERFSFEKASFFKDPAEGNFFVHGCDGPEKETFEIEGEKTQELKTDDGTIAFLEEIIGKDFAVAGSLRDYDLPVRARNCLEKGQSKNLWYEEVVPHKSIFCFAIIAPRDGCKLTFEDDPVQFGGNASIGNGYTKITEVFLHEERN